MINKFNNLITLEHQNNEDILFFLKSTVRSWEIIIPENPKKGTVLCLSKLLSVINITSDTKFLVE